MKVLAFDLGASSGRGIIAELKDGKITLNEIHRFPNNGINVRGTLYWDILYLFGQVESLGFLYSQRYKVENTWK